MQRDASLSLPRSVNVHTLTTHLRHRGKTRRVLAQTGKTYRRFERDHVNSLWQGDALVGPWLPDPYAPGKKRRAHLFCLIDDHSRLVPHAKFFFDEAFVKIVKRECLNRPFTTIQELKQALAEFVIYYNHFRLHSSLGYQPPVTRYLGVPAISGRGLSGIPLLLQELVAAFPAVRPVTVLPVNVATVKQRLALVSVSC